MGKYRSYLGKACVKCGSEDSLEIDHIDPATKAFTIASEWSKPWDEIRAELDKCQLLCGVCHLKKCEAERGEVHKHGTWGGYTNGKCRCPECKEVFNSYLREYRRRKREAQ